MKTMHQILQFFAIRLVSNEWEKLRPFLVQEYQNFINKTALFPSLEMQKLLISAEDHRFFSHPGFDLIAIFRCVYLRTMYGRIEGGSTIEQQIVRTLTGQYERTIRRKIKEILLAVLLSSVVPKRDLPGLYLQIGYYGWRMNSFREACLRLGLDARNMSLSAAAGVVSRLKYPEPRLSSPKREAQIGNRANHLMKLHSIHASISIYRGLPLQVKYATF
jgi:membrane peptidoglycan carboxypeptidase